MASDDFLKEIESELASIQEEEKKRPSAIVERREHSQPNKLNQTRLKINVTSDGASYTIQGSKTPTLMDALTWICHKRNLNVALIDKYCFRSTKTSQIIGPLSLFLDEVKQEDLPMIFSEKNSNEMDAENQQKKQADLEKLKQKQIETEKKLAEKSTGNDSLSDSLADLLLQLKILDMERTTQTDEQKRRSRIDLQNFAANFKSIEDQLQEKQQQQNGGNNNRESLVLSPNSTPFERVVFEITQTESNFLVDLKLIDEAFVRPLSADQILTTAQIDKLFSNVSDIRAFSEAFLNDLKQSKATDLASVFTKHLEKLNVFSKYCIDQPQVYVVLRQMESENQQFSQFLNTAKNSKKCRLLPLEAFLMAPVQRVCRYPILLKEAIKTAESDQPQAAASLKQVLNQVNDVVQKINNEKKRIETIEKLVEISNKLDGLPPTSPLVVMNREFLYEGNGFDVAELSEVKTLDGVNVLLFNDCLVLAEVREDLRPSAIRASIQTSLKELKQSYKSTTNIHATPPSSPTGLTKSGKHQSQVAGGGGQAGANSQIPKKYKFIAMIHLHSTFFRDLPQTTMVEMVCPEIGKHFFLAASSEALKSNWFNLLQKLKNLSADGERGAKSRALREQVSLDGYLEKKNGDVLRKGAELLQAQTNETLKKGGDFLMTKKGGEAFHRRFFVLRNNSLFYWNSKKKIVQVPLNGISFNASDESMPTCFQILSNGKLLITLKSENEEGMHKWMNAIMKSSLLADPNIEKKIQTASYQETEQQDTNSRKNLPNVSWSFQPKQQSATSSTQQGGDGDWFEEIRSTKKEGKK